MTEKVLESVIEKFASALEGKADEISLSKEEVVALTSLGEGALDELRKEAQMANAVPVKVAEYAELIADDDKELEKFAEFLASELPDDFTKTASVNDVTMYVNPVTGEILKLTMEG